MNKKQRAITQRLSKQELRFMCTALPLDEIYPPTKFHNHSNYSFGDTHRTKVKFESKQRAITEKKKKKANKSYGSCALHSPLMRSIHPQNFITIVSTVLEICSGQNSSMKINKGQTKFKYENKQRAITQKLSKQELQFMCTALPLDEIYQPIKFNNHS